MAVFRYFEIVRYKIYANLKAESARGGLGLLWWILDPVLYMGTFYFVFQYVLNRGGEGFVTFLITGQLVWKWFSNSVSRGATSILGGATLMRQVHLPKFLFPLITVFTMSINFLVVLLILFLFLISAGIPIAASWISLPLLIISQFLFILFIVGILAVVVPFLPDLMPIINNALILGLFVSGIFYDIESKPEQVKFFMKLNPMASLIIEYRKVLLNGLWPDINYLIWLSIVSILGVCIVYSISSRLCRVYPKIIN